MQDYSNIWNSYMEFWQRSLQEMSHLWFPALPDMKDSGKGKGAVSPFPMVSAENWATLFTPWMQMPKLEANIEPLMGEATKVSMRLFMPWHTDPLWVEALVGKQDQATGKAPVGKKGFTGTTQNPVELEVNDAIARSRTQD
ncbi:MAG: hypothetical protein LBQ75_05615 [Zoogloeaceae bacterium]|jgi:hypothetical protein|nr:hypothetical protein [Zoogloeaceae bacterium]